MVSINFTAVLILVTLAVIGAILIGKMVLDKLRESNGDGVGGIMGLIAFGLLAGICCAIAFADLGEIVRWLEKPMGIRTLFLMVSISTILLACFFFYAHKKALVGLANQVLIGGELRGHHLLIILWMWYTFIGHQVGVNLLARLPAGREVMVHGWGVASLFLSAGFFSELWNRGKISIPLAHQGAVESIGTRIPGLLLREGDYWLPWFAIQVATFNAKIINIDLSEKEFACKDKTDVVARFSLTLSVNNAEKFVDVKEEDVVQIIRKLVVKEINDAAKQKDAEQFIDQISTLTEKKPDNDLYKDVAAEAAKYGLEVGLILCQDIDFKDPDVKKAARQLLIEQKQRSSQEFQAETKNIVIKKIRDGLAISDEVAANIAQEDDGKAAPTTILNFRGKVEGLENLARVYVALGGQKTQGDGNNRPKRKNRR